MNYYESQKRYLHFLESYLLFISVFPNPSVFPADLQEEIAKQAKIVKDLEKELGIGEVKKEKTNGKR